MSVFNESVSSGLDVIDFLLSKFQFSHESLKNELDHEEQSKLSVLSIDEQQANP